MAIVYLHYITLHYLTLHYITLPYITLHYWLFHEDSSFIVQLVIFVVLC
jgi:hypothetical protein